jgi:hypothetical protein
MRLRSMEPHDVNWDGEEDDSDDVMDLDNTEVINLLDINHEMLGREEGIGFQAWLDGRLDSIERDDKLQELLEEIGLGDEEFDNADDI